LVAEVVVEAVDGMVVVEAQEEVGRLFPVPTHFFQEPTKLLLVKVVLVVKAVFILIQLKTTLRRVLQMALMVIYLQSSISSLQMVVWAEITDAGKLAVMVVQALELLDQLVVLAVLIILVQLVLLVEVAVVDRILRMVQWVR
jgi:hypothetical protein